MTPHAAAYHLLNSTFTDEHTGLTTPTRDQGGIASNICAAPEMLNAVVVDAYALSITNFDRADPPGYMPNDVPRDAAFNRNVLRIGVEAMMPGIDVQVECTNFVPSVDNPLHWRLQCRHVFCRHNNTGGYRYAGRCQTVDGEWQGTAAATSFRLFGNSSDAAVAYLHTPVDASPVGGHAILSIAAKPPGEPAYLLDYVHLRIAGTTPTPAEAQAEINTMCTGRAAHVATMIFICFRHESGFRQFSSGAQTQATMRFRQRHHGNNPAQPDCAVVFDWPDDPPNFPMVTYDFGVGISQYTITPTRTLEAATAWNWKANLMIGANILLANARRVLAATPGIGWRDLARESWRRYNGSGPQAVAYSAQLDAEPEAATIPNNAVPPSAAADLAALVLPPAQLAAPSWPPP